MRRARPKRAITEWKEDFNVARPHSSLGYQTPAAFAEVFTATGFGTVQINGCALSLVVQPAPYGVTEMGQALSPAG